MIGIRHSGSGEVQIIDQASKSGYGPEWTQIGPALPAGLAPENAVFGDGVWRENVEAVERELLAKVKAEAEQRQMMNATPGGYKKAEYAAKLAEVLAWDSLAGTATLILTAFNALPSNTRALRFKWAIASAASMGDTPADAIARFRGGVSRSQMLDARIGATAEKACADIRKAASAAAKRAAAAAVVWP